MTHLPAQGTRAGLVGLELLPDDGEVGLVGGEAEHDQVGCETNISVDRLELMAFSDSGGV